MAAATAASAEPLSGPIDPGSLGGMSEQRADGEEPNSSAERPRRAVRRRRRWPWVVVAVLIVAVGVVGWLGSRVLIVKDELEAAQSSLAAAQSGGDTRTAITTIATHSRAAAAAASDPLWRAAESTPWLGDNLRAVRLGAESLDALAGGLAAPALTAFETKDSQPVIARLLPILTAAAPRVTALHTDVAAIKKSDALLPPVRSAIDQLSPMLSTAASALSWAPQLLGAEGPKNYLVLAQNNAEWVGLGGSAAAQTLVNVDGGRITIKNQADSGDYSGVPVKVDVPTNALRLYHDVILRRINAVASRPDFPTAATLAVAMWQRDIHNDAIDAVVSIDPIALSQVLTATGPIAMGGETLTADNIVKKVLSDVYARNDPDYGDQYFKNVATAVFAKVAGGDFDPRLMLQAIQTGVRGGDIMLWSADPALQKKLAKMTIGGVLPSRNTHHTAVAVMLREASDGSKISYYMKPTVSVSASCAASGRTEFVMSTTLKLDIDQAAANRLPGYVKSYPWGAKKFLTEVFIYGPRGTTLDGADLPAGTAKLRKGVIVDLHRPVASYTIQLKPGQTRTITATFSGTGTYGPLMMRATPSVKGTDVKLSGSFCSSSPASPR